MKTNLSPFTSRFILTVALSMAAACFPLAAHEAAEGVAPEQVSYTLPKPHFDYYVHSANRVPYPATYSRGHLIFWDTVNRPYPFTPEPVWREMFRGIHERIAVEMYAIGVPGQAALELLYYEQLAEIYLRKLKEDSTQK